MKYLTELHCHSAETSGCSNIRGEELANIYKAKNYDAIVVTDHYYNGFFNALGEISWEDKINKYLSGYRNAKKRGDEIGLNVILGIELRFTDYSNDYLIFGLDEQFLYENPMLYDYGVKKFSEFSRERGFLFTQAHPCRDYMTIINQDYLDGIEIYNAHPWHYSRNKMAELLYEEQSKKRPFVAIVGSDCHNVSHEGRAGIFTEILPKDSAGLVLILKSGDYKIYKAED